MIRPGRLRSALQPVSSKASLWINGALDETGCRADRNRPGRIIKPGVKNDHIPPQGMVGNNDGITDAEGESQILPSLPGVLREGLPHVGAKDGVGAVSDFRVGVEQAQSSVCDRDARPAGPAVGEQELAVLVVGASRASLYADLVIVVFARAFTNDTQFHRVILFYPGEAVGYVVDGARGVRRIGPAAQSREVGQIHRWDAVREQLPGRKYVGIVEAAWHCRLRARIGPIKEIRRVYGYQHDVLAGADQNLVHHSGVQRPRMVE